MSRLIKRMANLDNSIVDKKTTHDICYDYVNNGLFGFSLDGEYFAEDHDIMPDDPKFDEVISKLVRAGLVYGDSIVIPAGAKVVEFNDLGNVINITLNINGHEFNGDFADIDEKDFA